MIAGRPMPTVTVVVRNLVNQLYFSCQLRLRQIFGDLGKASGLAILHPMGDDFLRSGQNALNQSDSAQARGVRWLVLICRQDFSWTQRVVSSSTWAAMQCCSGIGGHGKTDIITPSGGEDVAFEAVTREIEKPQSVPPLGRHQEAEKQKAIR
ncbi:TPA: hypothetical protein SIA39_001068 [Aeromonas sobria]|nr:hypothetical protein [Aeromonas sobria]